MPAPEADRDDTGMVFYTLLATRNRSTNELHTLRPLHSEVQHISNTSSKFAKSSSNSIGK